VVLSFHDSILLRNAWGGELLINTVLKAKLIERGIPELSPIITVNGFQAVEMLIVQPHGYDPKVLKHLDDTGTKHLTFLIILKSHIILMR
jgi:hypothetical protein